MRKQAVPPIEYADLEIRILERRPEGYPVEITLNHEQEFPRGYLTPSVLPWVASSSPFEDGERLFQLLFADERVRVAWAEIRGQTPFRRVRLRIDESAPELHAIPWELLREIGPNVPPQTLAATVATPFSRDLAGTWRPVTRIQERPIKLLVAIANPDNLADYPALQAIDVEAEKRTMIAAVAGVSENELELSFLPTPVTLASVESALKAGGDHILHIIAHGMHHPTRDQSILFLADAANRVARVGEAAFAEMLARQRATLRLVFLASCQSATRSSADAFRGFAPRLILAGVPAVVAMQDLVTIATARDFTSTFYRQLLCHGLVDVAANEARSALISADTTSGWAVPVLFSRVPEGRILAPADAPRSWRERLRQHPAVVRTVAITSMIIAILSAITMVLDLTGAAGAAREPGGMLHGVWPAPTPTPTPMGSGFNVAVAQFAFQDASGHLTLTNESQELSEWLFAAIGREVQQLPSALSIGLRGPSEVGLVPEADDAEAAQMAKRHHATVLIYGVVKPSTSGYVVEPKFYVADAGFTFGSELVGSDRLGTPVMFTTPLTAGGQLKINEQLNARMLALRHTITGLALFYLGRYDESGASFRRAATVEGWRDEDGKEVAYLLIGAAKLRLYNQQAEAGVRSVTLAQAAEAFSQTYRLNPNYARGYLGMGAVALQEATMPAPNASGAVACATRGIPRVDIARLQAALKWYTNSQALADQPRSAHIAAKADYGLGQIQLLGFECALPGWSADTAQRAFARVVAAYETERSPDLTWLAGNAYAYLGRLAGHRRDWTTMMAEYNTAIDLFNAMPGDPPRKSIALAWESVAYAAEQRGQLDSARDAYRQAIKIGTNAVEGSKVDSWRRKLDQLGAGH